MENIANLPKRTLKEINENRRRLLQEGYEVFPGTIDCDKTEFNWDEVEARINIFDIYYLNHAGYVNLLKTEETTEKTMPFYYSLTSAGIDLLENPGEIDSRFPIINISGIQGNVTVGNGNIVNSSINELAKIQEEINHLKIPDTEKKPLLDKLQSVSSILGTVLEVGKTVLGS